LSGLAFWRAFLFETPFVIGRVGFPFVFELMFLVLTVVMDYWAFRAWRLYRQHLCRTHTGRRMEADRDD
jgi:hypothetical protein